MNCSEETDFLTVGRKSSDLFGIAFSDVCRFAELLVEHGSTLGLIGDKEVPRLWSRHLVNSAMINRFIGDKVNNLADIGTGAGFPAVILALMRPDIDIYAIESMDKRCQWLHFIQEQIDIDNLIIVRERSENYKKKKFDVVTSRAVARLDKLVRISAHLVKGGGKFLALKGEKAQIECEEAKYVLRKAGLIHPVVHTVIAPGDKAVTRIVEAQKKK